MLHARTDYDHIQDPTGKIPADEPVVLLRAQDAAFVPTLQYYKSLSINSSIRSAIEAHILRGLAWQAEHGKKTADMPADAIRDLFE